MLNSPPTTSARSSGSLLILLWGLLAGGLCAAWLGHTTERWAKGVCHTARTPLTAVRDYRIDALLVQDGEAVIAGQTLARVTDIRAADERLRLQREVDRLQEALNQANVRFDAELTRRMDTIERQIHHLNTTLAQSTAERSTPVRFVSSSSRAPENVANRLRELQKQRLQLPAEVSEELGIPTLRQEWAEATAALRWACDRPTSAVWTAPADGIVCSLRAVAGATIPAGTDLLTVADSEQDFVLVEVPRQLNLDLGAVVQIRLPREATAQGRVVQIQSGRRLAGTAVAADDAEWVTLRIVPDGLAWPEVRDGSGVVVTWTE